MLILLTLMACSGPNDETGNGNSDFVLDALTPESDATDVALDTPIIAQFSKDLRVGDIGVADRRSVSGFSGDTLTAELAEPLDRLTTYTLRTLGVQSIDGDAIEDIQSLFTTRDGDWQSADTVTGPAPLVSYASASAGDATWVLTARAGRTEVLTLRAEIEPTSTLLDSGASPDNAWLLAVDDSATAIWTQGEDLFTASSSDGNTWSAPHPLAESDASVQQPTGLALTADGTAAVGWRASAVQTQVATRVNSEWSDPVPLGCASAGECRSIHLHADDTGELSAFIHRLTVDGQELLTSSFRDGAWTVPQVSFTVDGTIGEPVIRTQPGETLAVWAVTDSVDAGLYISRLQEDGSWSDATQVREAPSIREVDLAALPDGSWTTSWVETHVADDADQHGLWLSGVERASLTDPFRLTESRTPFGDVDLVADAGGNLHLTWTELSLPSQLHTRRFNHRTGWEDPITLATGSEQAEVLVLPGNRAHAVFVADDQLMTARFE